MTGYECGTQEVRGEREDNDDEEDNEEEDNDYSGENLEDSDVDFTTYTLNGVPEK